MKYPWIVRDMGYLKIDKVKKYWDVLMEHEKNAEGKRDAKFWLVKSFCIKET